MVGLGDIAKVCENEEKAITFLTKQGVSLEFAQDAAQAAFTNKS